jgi:hypothetical protein
MKITTIALSELHQDPTNPNKRDEVETLKASLAEFGLDQPLVVQKETGRIIKGNHRFMAAQELGWEEIDIIEVTDDDLKATRRGLADNRTGELRYFDEYALQALLKEVGDNVPGFDTDFLEDMGNKLNPPDLDDLEKEFGEPSPDDFWPVIRIKIPPELMERWNDLVEQSGDGGHNEVAAFEYLMDLHANSPD